MPRKLVGAGVFFQKSLDLLCFVFFCLLLLLFLDGGMGGG